MVGEARKHLVKHAGPCTVNMSDEVACADESCVGCLQSEEVVSVLRPVKAVAGKLAHSQHLVWLVLAQEHVHS